MVMQSINSSNRHDDIKMENKATTHTFYTLQRKLKRKNYNKSIFI